MPKSQEFELNEEQRRAVEHGEGPLLVVAGAGTGKTRVITERIRRLLEDHADLPGEAILGLTFTDKAAGEMKHRVVKSIGERAEGVWLSTFHKFCLDRVLKAADPNVEVLDTLDHRILLRRNIGELGLKHFKRLQEPAEFLSDFEQFFSRCQDELVSPDDYDRYAAGLRQEFGAQKKTMEADAREIAEVEIEKQEELARVYRTSERLLRERNFVTFGGQLQRAVELLKSDAALRRQVRGEFRYILVDEFQDTNIAQLELLWLLAEDHRNIVAVGDDAQAIYRFRGASFGSFTIFLKRFCGVREPKHGPETDKHLVSLAQNYRSTRRILRVAEEVIANNEPSPLLPPKHLVTQNRDGEKIRVAEFAAPTEEAHWVAGEILRLHEAGAPWSSFAVLYRKHAHREELLSVLRRMRIPFVIRKNSILSSTLIRDLLAWFRLIGEPGDNVACARALAAPYWGLEPKDLVRLAERAEKNHRRPLAHEAETAQNEAPFTREGVRLGEFTALLERLRQSARKQRTSELLDELIAALELSPLPSDADSRYLERFVEFVKEWERKSEGKKLADFLEYLFYFREAGGDIQLDEIPTSDAVQLMTVHGAKGLEFPHVFIVRVSKNDFPSGARRPAFEFPAELMKEEKPKGDFQIQEERRLFYVALTRARQRLTLSTIVNKRKKPSPFLEDFLRNPKIKAQDAQQLSPSVAVPPAEEAAGAQAASSGPARLFGAAGENAKAYSRVALWAKAYHPPRPEPLQLSASAIEAYKGCPMKYEFQYGWSLRGGPHADMTFGNVMHKTVKDFVESVKGGNKPSLDDVLASYEREWSSAGFPDAYQEEEYKKTGREELAAFYKTYSKSPAEVIHQEKAFELPLEHEVLVTGRIDQINRLDGGVEIMDYKTGKPKDQKKTDENLQLSVYALAAQEALELDPRRLVFYNLVTNEGVATSRDGKALNNLKEEIYDIAGLIRAGQFEARPGFGCRYCDFKPLCPAHEELVAIGPRQAEGAETA
ncbi:MAG TPA: ATP-dependent DNA helicase [Verrucomicrobiae bacterium]|nr:ATP-dependent DNA helicase [Verrucomicrobiae bacterium]